MVKVDEPYAHRVSELLQRWGGFSPANVPVELFLTPGKTYAFRRNPLRVDIFTGPSGVEFCECHARRNLVVWNGITVPLIGLDDLRANKLASGRPKDLADVEYLPKPNG